MTIIENPNLFAGAVFSAPALVNKIGYINVRKLQDSVHKQLCILQSALLRVIAFLSPQYTVLNYSPNVISTDPVEVLFILQCIVVL